MPRVGSPRGPHCLPPRRWTPTWRLTDDELEAVVGGLARVYIPGTTISAVQAPA